MTHVYVIQAEGGPVKIGVALDPARRLAALRTSAPFPLSLAHVEPIAGELRAVAVERAAHALLKAARAHGEWFAVSVEEARSAIHEAIVGLGVRAAPTAEALETAATLHAVQLKMARVALGLTTRQAADVSGVSHGTITRIEAGEALKDSTVQKVRSALEAAGVQFIERNGGGRGVRLRDPDAS